MESNISKIEKEEEENYEKMTFPIIAEESKANAILNEILSNKLAIIGIDTEAALEMSRFGILCLIQVINNILIYLSYRYHIMIKFSFLIC